MHQTEHPKKVSRPTTERLPSNLLALRRERGNEPGIPLKKTTSWMPFTRDPTSLASASPHMETVCNSCCLPFAVFSGNQRTKAPVSLLLFFLGHHREKHPLWGCHPCFPVQKRLAPSQTASPCHSGRSSLRRARCPSAACQRARAPLCLTRGLLPPPPAGLPF